MNRMDDKQNVYLDQDFKDLELVRQSVVEKEFDNCHFFNCNFSESSFIECKFYQCKFTNCNLSTVDVKGSSFFDVIFEESKLIGINWAKAYWPKVKLNSPLQFIKCVLNHSSFFGLCLRELIMIECKAKEVDFREADCSEANFSYTDFSDSLFGKTILISANFTEAINYNIDVFNNSISKAKFVLPEAIRLLYSLDIELSD